VSSLLASVDLEPRGVVRWNTPVLETGTGVYVVSLTEVADEVAGVKAAVPLSDTALSELIAVCPSITLDGEPRPAREQVASRIGSYWLADECVLYIGLAGQPLRSRVRQYYRTPLGAAKPHKGGWWLKTLSVLSDLYVHYAVAPNFKEAEDDMLRTFAATVSEASRARWPAGDPLMPFANLRDGDWRRRQHGIRSATSAAPIQPAAGSKRTAPPFEPATVSTGAPARFKSRSATTAAHHQSQEVTANDIQVGQVRIPRGITKTILPPDRCDVVVALRRHELRARWDPRYGPPERSGVIRLGKAVAAELLSPGDVLAVTVGDGAVVELQ
jgi:hypothetical protein